MLGAHVGGTKNQIWLGYKAAALSAICPTEIKSDSKVIDTRILLVKKQNKTKLITTYMTIYKGMVKKMGNKYSMKYYAAKKLDLDL